MTYQIYIKSHIDAPDYEATCEADSFSKAAKMFHSMLQGEFDLHFIKEHMDLCIN